jgi:hypothetical protein
MDFDYTDPKQLALYKQILFGNLRVRIRGEEITYLDGLKEHPGQRQIHFDPWRYLVLDWGRRTGKTIGVAAEIVAELGLPERKIWIVAPNYELTDRVFEWVYKWVVLDQCFGQGTVRKASKTRDNRYIEMVWGSMVRGKSAEAPDSLVGEQLDLVAFDECARCSEMIWLEALEPTTIDREGRVMFVSTPRGKNWFYEYFLRGEAEETIAKGWASSNFKTWENPFVKRDWLDTKKAQTPEIIWRREYEGSFEDFGGRIYPDFRAKLVKDGGHLFDPKETPLGQNWTVYRGIDVGFRLPTACVWGKVDEKGNVWIFREYEEANTIHEDHAENINARSPEPIYQTYISPDAARRFGDGSEYNSPLKVYQRAGIFARQAIDDFGPGVSLVSRYLRATLEENPDHPKLFISTQCPTLIKHLENYQYHEVQNRQDLDQPEKPRKKDDHLPDALRYMLTARPRFLREWRQRDDIHYEDNISRYGYQRAAFLADRGKRKLDSKNPATGRPKILGIGK